MSELMGKVERATTISILGQKKCGKTRGSAHIINNLTKPCVVVDTVGAYTKDGLIAHAKYFNECREATPQQVAEAMHKTIEGGYKCVLDISDLSARAKHQFMKVVCVYCMEVGKRIGSLALCVDEVGEFVPQDPTSSVPYSEDYEQLVRIGRNNGVDTVIQISQRPQKVSKEVLALSDLYLIMRVHYYRDRNIVKDILGVEEYQVWKTLSPEIKTLPMKRYILHDEDGNTERGEFPEVQENRGGA